MVGDLMKKKTNNEPKYTTQQEQELNTNLDPQLQRAILEARTGAHADTTLGLPSEVQLLVDVIAKLRDSSQAVTGLNIVRSIGNIVTGTVSVSDIDSVRSDPNVISLKAARPVKPQLKFSVPEVQATKA